MKARTPTRGTHPVPSKSISSQSIPDIPSLLPLNNVFLPSGSTDPAGRKILFLEQNIEKTER